MDPYLIHSGIVGMNSVWNLIFGRAAKKKLTMPTPPKISWITLFCRSCSRLLWHAPDFEWSPYLLGMNELKSASYQMGASGSFLRKNGNSAYNEQVIIWSGNGQTEAAKIRKNGNQVLISQQKGITGYHWFICNLEGLHVIRREAVSMLDL